MKEIYLVVDNYTLDAGSTIYSAHTTIDQARKEIERLSSDDNEYGSNMNERDTLDWVSVYLQEED